MARELIEITESVLEQMIDHARADQPHETCALLLGGDDRIEEYYSMSNLNDGLDELTAIDGIDEAKLSRLREHLSLENSSGKLNVNEATEEQLADLEEVDEEMAKEIVDRRRRIGRYEDPTVHFKFDPGEQVKAQNYARKNDWDVLGVYHSHPAHDSEAFPSSADQAMGHGGYVYFILNFQPDETIINAFEFVDDEVKELEYDVVG